MFHISVRYLFLFYVVISLYDSVASLNWREHENNTWMESTNLPLHKVTSHPQNKNHKPHRNEHEDPVEKGLNLTEIEMIYFKLWPQGIIPYYIDIYSYKDKVLRDQIRSFLSEVNSLTEINFVELPRPPPDDEVRWVFFVNRRGLLGCADHSVTNFTTKGVQQVVLGYDCMSTRNELAEAILSIVGVPSQHNAPDRDNYIEVIAENIIPAKRYLFNKINENDWLFHSIDYDFKSASHFDLHKHSRNGKATIRIKDENFRLPETKKEFSADDIIKMTMLYKFMMQKRPLTVDDCQKLFLDENTIKKLRNDVTNEFNKITSGTFVSNIYNIFMENSQIYVGERKKHKRKHKRRHCKRRHKKRSKCKKHRKSKRYKCHDSLDLSTSSDISL